MSKTKGQGRDVACKDSAFGLLRTQASGPSKAMSHELENLVKVFVLSLFSNDLSIDRI